jgi:hypothetical protein
MNRRQVLAALGGAAVALPRVSVAGSPPVLRYVSGSTVKLEQLLGEEDKELHRPTLSRTVSRYRIEGTDLGYSFEHEGKDFFLFGDTVSGISPNRQDLCRGEHKPLARPRHRPIGADQIHPMSSSAGRSSPAPSSRYTMSLSIWNHVCRGPDEVALPGWLGPHGMRKSHPRPSRH